MDKYLEHINLNRYDPDYQLEDFWYGFKKSMINFYIKVKKDYNHVENWSNLLNEYKKDKEYNKIANSINEFIAIYAKDLMKYDNLRDKISSNILMTNIRRFRKILLSFDNIQKNKYEYIIILFEAFNLIKLKRDEQLYPLLEQFRDIELLVSTQCQMLIYSSFELGQCKVLESIEKIITRNNVMTALREVYPNIFTINSNHISYIKLYKNYINSLN